MLQTHGQIRIIQSPLWVQTNYLLGGRDTARPAHSMGHLCTSRQCVGGGALLPSPWRTRSAKDLYKALKPENIMAFIPRFVI